MDGLIIKEKWLNLILDDKKTFEIRGHSTKKLNEPIYLLESGSKKIRGTCEIIASHPITKDNWDKYKKKACLDMNFEELSEWYSTPYAWELAFVEPVTPDTYYAHPKGAVIWVKNVEEI